MATSKKKTVKKSAKKVAKKKAAKKTAKKVVKEHNLSFIPPHADMPFVPTEIKAREWLPFDLTDQEKISIGQELSALKENLDKTQQELKQITNRFRNNIKLYESEINSRFNILRDGFESRQVNCTKRVDFDKKTVEFHYENKLISTRPL